MFSAREDTYFLYNETLNDYETELNLTQYPQYHFIYSNSSREG